MKIQLSTSSVDPRIRYFLAFSALGWAVCLICLPDAMNNPACGNMAWLPHGGWATLFWLTSVALLASQPGRQRSFAAGLSMALWGMLCISILTSHSPVTGAVTYGLMSVCSLSLILGQEPA